MVEAALCGNRILELCGGSCKCCAHHVCKIARESGEIWKTYVLSACPYRSLAILDGIAVAADIMAKDQSPSAVADKCSKWVGSIRKSDMAWTPHTHSLSFNAAIPLHSVSANISYLTCPNILFGTAMKVQERVSKDQKGGTSHLRDGCADFSFWSYEAPPTRRIVWSQSCELYGSIPYRQDWNGSSLE